eukprot:5572487-Amphidinium_carterae.2
MTRPTMSKRFKGARFARHLNFDKVICKTSKTIRKERQVRYTMFTYCLPSTGLPQGRSVSCKASDQS